MSLFLNPSKLGLKNDSFIIKADIKESLVIQKLIF